MTGTSTTRRLQAPAVCVADRRTDVRARLSYFIIGFSPIGALALSIVGIVPLHIGGPLLVSAAIIAGCAIACTHPEYGGQVARGLLSGLVAVLVYDCTRIPFVLLGGWPDFIPKIGSWLFDDPQTHWSVGYLWRYLGNGSGMGMAFTMTVPLTRVRVDPRLSGVLFGLAVWSGLLVTLAIAPDGEGKLFVLTPATFGLSLIGHIVFGGVLGFTADRMASRL